MAKKDTKESQIDKHVNRIIQTLNKKFYPQEDQRIIQKLDDAPTVASLGVIPTGSLLLDQALGVGGLPIGRIVEIYGHEGSGKTTIGLHLIAEAQRLNEKAGDDKYVLFIDAEHALDPDYAKAIGVDPSKLIVVQPDYAEQALNIVAEFVISDSINLFVIDSVAALMPEAEYKGSMEDQHVGRQARVMSQALRKLNGMMCKHYVLGIFINQVREKIGVMFGNPETTPGGRALKFWSTIRLACSSKRVSDQEQRSERAILKVDVVKNKVAPPHKTIETEILFGYGIDLENEILALCISEELIEKKGSWYSYGGEQLGQGIENTKEFFKNNPDIYTQIQEQIKDIIYNRKNKITEDAVENKEDEPKEITEEDEESVELEDVNIITED